MPQTPEHYQAVIEGCPFDLTESFTCVVVAGGTRESVAAALRVDLTAPCDPGQFFEDLDRSAYALVEVAGGVVAVEASGYADPSLTALAALSAEGGAAAVTRSNIQAHLRFGCARDGEVAFDDDEFVYLDIDDKDRVPIELRELFESAGPISMACSAVWPCSRNSSTRADGSWASTKNRRFQGATTMA